MRIGRPKLSERGDFVQYEVAIDRLGHGPSSLWYRVTKDFGSLLSDRADGALVGLLAPAMFAGEDIEIEGPVSPQLVYSFTGPGQSMVRKLLPRLKRVAIRAENVSDAGGRAAGVATGFSGGVDSFTVLATHYFKENVPGYRPTHLLFNSVGSHGQVEPDRLAKIRFARLSEVAREIGLPYVRVESNLDDFYAGNMKFQETHTLRNGSVPLILQSGVGRFLYASGYQYRDIGVHDTHDMACADPMLLPLISTDAVDMGSANCDLSRVEKTFLIAETELTYRHLDICAGPTGRNCSHCGKCRRTMATLELTGKLDRYSAIFDLKKYGAVRNRYRLEVALSRSPIMREIADYARENRLDFPTSYRLFMGAPDRNRYRLEVALSRSPIMREIADYARENRLDFPTSYRLFMGAPDAIRSARSLVRKALSRRT